MKHLLQPGLLRRWLFLLSVIFILGLVFRPHELARDYWQVRKARGSAASGDLLAAAQALVRLAERIPWRTGFWERAGEYALQGGDPASAVRYLSDAEATHGLSTEGLATLGMAYQQTGDASLAIQAWERAIQSGQASANVYMQLYQAHLEQGNYAAAAHDLQALAGRQPLDASLSYQLGLLLAALDPESALAHLAQAADLHPSLSASARSVIAAIRTGLLGDDPVYTLLSAGRALAALNEWQLARQAFQEAIAARPDYAEAWAFLGEASQHPEGLNQEISALDMLEKALALDPNSLSANSLLGLYWRRQGDHERALQYYQRAAEIEANNPILQVDLGNALAHAGVFEAALAAFHKAIELAPRDPASYRHLATFSLSYEYQVRQVALPAARQALLLNPDDPASLVTMGQVLTRLGDLATAERYLSSAVRADPSHASAHLQLGLVYILRGDRQAAFSKWVLVQNLAPGTPAADHAQRLLQNYFP